MKWVFSTMESPLARLYHCCVTFYEPAKNVHTYVGWVVVLNGIPNFLTAV